MARPTRLAAELAKATGEPASRVQRWIEDGYGPATPEIDAAEHFRHLVPLMGTGKNGNVAVLKMAADGYPCRRLREVLVSLFGVNEPGFSDPDELVNEVMGDDTLLGRGMIMSDAPMEPPSEWQAMPEASLRGAELRGLLTGSALLPLADLATGRPVEPGDLHDLSRHGPWRRLGLPEPPVSEGDEAAMDLLCLRICTAAVLNGQAWVEKASPRELAEHVAAAMCLAEALEALYPAARSQGEEKRWLLVGALTPSAPTVLRVLQALVGDLDGPGAGYPHTPEIDAYLAAIRQGPSFGTGADESRRAIPSGDQDASDVG
ncbi:MAG: hypothetical protein M0Z46_21130 [Actinomycetota bacterium]|nr:hypothetical protein [Actinomycetota bacterium]